MLRLTQTGKQVLKKGLKVNKFLENKKKTEKLSIQIDFDVYRIFFKLLYIKANVIQDIFAHIIEIKRYWLINHVFTFLSYEQT